MENKSQGPCHHQRSRAGGVSFEWKPNAPQMDLVYSAGSRINWMGTVEAVFEGDRDRVDAYCRLVPGRAPSVRMYPM